MFIILLLTVIGFLIGLSYVMIRDKIKLNRILSAAFLGVLFLSIWKFLRDYKKKNRRWL